MAYTQNDSETVIGSQEAFEKMLHERLREAVRIVLISVLEEEVTAFIGALPYERNAQRHEQRNGHYTRNLETTMGQIVDLPIARTPGGYHTQVFKRYHRRRDELDTAIAQMFVDGVSMTKVGPVVEPQRFDRRARLPHPGERVSSVETTSAGRALCVRSRRWYVLHGDLQRRRL